MRVERTLLWQQRFLKSLRSCPNVTAACKAGRVGRQTVYSARKSDPAFAAAWQDALDASVDELEARAFQLALEGDSRLVEFMLRCHRPNPYRETTRAEVAVVGGIVFLPAKEAGNE